LVLQLDIKDEHVLAIIPPTIENHILTLHNVLSHAQTKVIHIPNFIDFPIPYLSANLLEKNKENIGLNIKDMYLSEFN